MHVAHVQASMSPEHGGPTRSLANYCQCQAKSGVRVSLWTLEGYRNASGAMRLEPPVANHVFQTRAPRQLGRSPELRQGLKDGEPPDIYHLHGAWSLAMLYGAEAARRQQRPHVVELMGMYEAWCLRKRWFEKRLLRSWFQDRILRQAACLHVNSRKEAQDLSELGFNRPIAVIPVGVDTDAVASQVAGLPVTSPWPVLDETRFVLYFSRIHPKKGLDLLIQCWARVARNMPDVRLVVAGSGDAAYVAQCHALANTLGVADRCIWTGHVNEQEKSWLMSRAHCYVLPTHSENFGNTVAEALAHSTPVITTTQTPWSDLEPNACGWRVGDNVDELGGALDAALRLDDPDRMRMGENGASLVRQRYSLKSVTKDTLAIYDWVTGTGPRPDCLLC